LTRKRKTAPAEEAPIEEPTEEAQEAPAREPTLADRYVAMLGLIVEQRVKTRLQEATLVKTFEIALQWHAWQTQMDAQRVQQSPFPPGFDPSMLPEVDETLEPDEYLGPVAVEDSEDTTDA
jgi:hypothetical protein